MVNPNRRIRIGRRIDRQLYTGSNPGRYNYATFEKTPAFADLFLIDFSFRHFFQRVIIFAYFLGIYAQAPVIPMPSGTSG
jgi:hypothetical protein